MKAEIISVGTELLLGFIVDTNAAYLAQQLAAMGIDLYYVSTFGDNLDRLADGTARAFERSDLIVFTGGLGPTEDDLTRDAIAKALGETLTVDPELAAGQKQFWSRRNLPMPPRNLTQAQVIPSAKPLPNPLGTAPGWWVEHNGKIAVAMPGVPREMFRMWEQEAVPRIRERGGLGIILTRTLKILGKGESAVEHDVRSFLSMTNPTIATYAKSDGVHLRISAKSEDEATAAALIADLEKKVLENVGPDVYGYDDATLGSTLAAVLGDRTFALSDTLTCGGLTQALTETAEMAAKFAGGIIGASPAASPWAAFAGKAGSPGAALALAADARSRFSAPVGIGVTGVAGPDAIDGVEPGTFSIAVDDGTPVVQTSFRSSTPAEIRRWTSYTALNLVWRKLAGRPLPT